MNMQDKDQKKVWKKLAGDIVSDKNVRVNYIRKKNKVRTVDYDGSYVVDRGKPYGVVVSKIIDGCLHIGWSLLKREDSKLYDKNYGILLATNRLKPLDSYLNDNTVPREVRKTMANLLARNVLYYKGVSTPA